MNNVLPTSIKIHEKYDLKGFLSDKRKASVTELSKESPTLRDFDFVIKHPKGLFLEPEDLEVLMQRLKQDCKVLESFNIMDYSLLLGVHNLDLAAKENAETVENFP